MTHQNNKIEIFISICLSLASVSQLVSKSVQRGEGRDMSQNSWIQALAVFSELSSGFLKTMMNF